MEQLKNKINMFGQLISGNAYQLSAFQDLISEINKVISKLEAKEVK